MASNIKASPERNIRGAPEKQALETRDIPLPLLHATGKEVIRSAYVDEVETEEAELGEEAAAREEPEEEGERENELVKVQHGPVPTKSGAKKPAERSEDPVR